MPLPVQGFNPSIPISDNTRGVPVSMSGMTIYELLRSLVRSANWTYENEMDASAFIDQLESLGFFGNLGDTVKSKELK